MEKYISPAAFCGIFSAVGEVDPHDRFFFTGRSGHVYPRCGEIDEGGTFLFRCEEDPCQRRYFNAAPGAYSPFGYGQQDLYPWGRRERGYLSRGGSSFSREGG